MNRRTRLFGGQIKHMENRLLKLLKKLFSKNEPELVGTAQSEVVEEENHKLTQNIKPAESDTSSVLTKLCKSCGTGMEVCAKLLPGLQSEVQSGTGGKARFGYHKLQELWENRDASGECPALA